MHLKRTCPKVTSLRLDGMMFTIPQRIRLVVAASDSAKQRLTGSRARGGPLARPAWLATNPIAHFIIHRQFWPRHFSAPPAGGEGEPHWALDCQNE